MPSPLIFTEDDMGIPRMVYYQKKIFFLFPKVAPLLGKIEIHIFCVKKKSLKELWPNGKALVSQLKVGDKIPRLCSFFHSFFLL